MADSRKRKAEGPPQGGTAGMSEAEKRARAHYNSSTQAETRTFDQAARQRMQDRTYQLKRFHNSVKARLISYCSRNAAWHLDLACGRGGDMNKWHRAGIRNVVAVDISEVELSNARDRLEDLRRRNPRQEIRFDFRHNACVGSAAVDWGREFDSVSCMFAAHYFFASMEMAEHFMANAARSLRPGGFFYGTLPSGKAIIKLLAGRDSYKSDLLHVVRKWPGKFDELAVVGKGYTFAILQTVTNTHVASDEIGEGCEEYLVFFSFFAQLAARCHLYPEQIDWNLPQPGRGGGGRGRADPLFRDSPEEAKAYPAFRNFGPQYDPRNPDSRELEKVSRLNSAFVFRMRLDRPCTDDCLLHPRTTATAAASTAPPRP